MGGIISRMKAAAREQNIAVDFKHSSKTELYHDALFLFEGFQLPYHVSDSLFKIAEELVEERKETETYNNIRHGLWELENGVINLGDFLNGKELAHYLTKGAFL